MNTTNKYVKYFKQIIIFTFKNIQTLNHLKKSVI